MDFADPIWRNILPPSSEQKPLGVTAQKDNIHIEM
jgi:hypothetical protein